MKLRWILQVHNQPKISTTQQVSQSPLLRVETYESFVNQVYNFQFDYLIKWFDINIISFQQIVQMLQNHQIERYILDPTFQQRINHPKKF